MAKKELLFILIGFLLIINVNAFENASLMDNATICINESEQTLNQLIAENFSVLRVNDSLQQAISFYNSQTILKEKKQKYDFSRIITYCNEIKNIKENATQTKDEFDALIIFYNESFPDKNELENNSKIKNTINEIQNEIYSERYEKVKDLVDKAYNEIIEYKSSKTALNIFYTSTTRSLLGFLNKNKISLSVSVSILIIFLLVYKRKISIWIVKRKIEKLEIRKKTLRDLIGKTQKSYFEYGLIAQGSYMIRTKKFAEMIRDIDRQIPLLKEKLIKIERINKNKK